MSETHMDKAAREKARELCGRFPAGPWAILNYVEAAPYPNYHQAIAVSTVIDSNKSIVDEHSVRELAIAARTLLPQALDALDAADSDNTSLRARVAKLEAALASEREKCAEVCDELMRTTSDLGIRSGAVDCAYLIRARTASRR